MNHPDDKRQRGNFLPWAALAVLTVLVSAAAFGDVMANVELRRVRDERDTAWRGYDEAQKQRQSAETKLAECQALGDAAGDAAAHEFGKWQLCDDDNKKLRAQLDICRQTMHCGKP